MKNYTPGAFLTNMAMALQASTMLVLLMLPILIRNVLGDEISFLQMLFYLLLCIVAPFLIFTIVSLIGLLFKSSREPNAQIDGQNLILDGESIALSRISEIYISAPTLATRIGYHPIRMSFYLDNDKRKSRLIEKPSLSLIKAIRELATNAKMHIFDKLFTFVIEPAIALVAGILIAIFC